MLSLAATKAVVLVLMTVLTLSACFLPILVRRVAAKALRQNGMKMFMSGCLCFGGGVLLATVFLHLIPETRMSFEKASSLGFLPPMPYPLTELVVCLGFFFVYIVEEAVHSCISRGDGNHNNHNNHSHHSHLGHIPTENPAPDKPRVKETAIDGDDGTLEKFLPEGESGDDVSVKTGVKVASMRAVMVVVALSLHSIMEGLALGLVHSNKDVWMLFAALSAHKLIIAFCMAMELLSSGVSWPAFFISLTIFSVASPLGGLVGTLVVSLTAQTTPAGILVPTVLHGLSAGTLLYVTFCEILERERANPQNPILKLVSLLGAFLLMAVLQIVDILFAPEENPIPLAANASALPSTTFPVYNAVPELYKPDQA